MRLLLDTRAALWWVQDDARLGADAVRELEAGNAEVLLSAVVTWEVAIKRASGKLEVDPGYLDALLGGGARELPVTIAHAEETARLPPLHRDPFDRLLIAQARVEGTFLVTADPRIAAYDVPVLW